jgi:hypothetical protein
MQRVQMFKRFISPLITMCFLCTFGRKSRFVRRFEKLTLCPNDFVLPQTSHCPATEGLPFCQSARALVSGSADIFLLVRRVVLHQLGAKWKRQPGGRRHSNGESYHAQAGWATVTLAVVALHPG